MNDKLTALIPAGGEGTRLRPHTDTAQKPMLLMGTSEQRIIDFSLRLSLESDHALVTTNCDAERAQPVESYVSSHRRVTVLRDLRRIGAGSLLDYYHVFSQEDPDGDLVVLPGDLVCENFSLAAFQDHHRDSNAAVTLLVVPQKDYGEYVTIKDGRALEIIHAPIPGSLSTTGIYMFDNDYLLSWMRKELERGWNGEIRGMYKDIIGPAVVNNKAAVYEMPPEGYWDDAGTLRRYHKNNMRFSNGDNVISPEVVVPFDADIQSSIIMGSPQFDRPIRLRNAIVSGLGRRIEITSNAYA
jgi:ADP-glucose pyrophosphorylase